MDVNTIVKQLDAGARQLRATPLTGGVSAEVIGVDFTDAAGGAQRIVVRTHRDMDGKADRQLRARREFALLETLHARGLKVPRPRLFVPPQTLVIDHIDGSTQLPDDPVEAFADALAMIHRVSLADLPELPQTIDPMPSLREWLRELAAHDQLHKGCGEYTAAPCLLHGDYWPGNVLWRGRELVAVLDWEDAAIGDPMSDVACARVELACMVNVDTAQRFTQAYGRKLPVDAARLPWWDLYVTAAALHSMAGWGLPPDKLADRRAKTQTWQAAARKVVGID